MASYTVKPGDTLSAIARRNNTTVATLLSLNPALTTNPKYNGGKTIFSGTKVTLPGGTPTAPAPTPTPTPMPAPVTTPTQTRVSEGGLLDRFRASLFSPATTQLINTAESRAVAAEARAEAAKAEREAAGTGTAVTPETNPAPVVEDNSSQEIPLALRPTFAATPAEYQDYLRRLAMITSDTGTAQAANALAARSAQATYEPQIRQAERNIYGAEMRALSQLAERGITGVTGISEAAKRSARLAPLQQRTAAIAKLADTQRSANVLLAEQIAKAQKQREEALSTVAKATRISNQLGGRSNG